jgi:hypothetical protein
MDRVRFGRALGYGVRQAAKTVAEAVDAATSPDPRATSNPPATQQPINPVRSVEDVQRTVIEAHQRVQSAKSKVRSQMRSQFQGAAKEAGKSALAPVAKFSSVLWLQVTGTFFGLLAMVMFEAVWKLRSALHAAPTSPDRLKFYACSALAALFAYFTTSNFVRASRRQRR